jgi:hypothetical protein
MPWVKIDDRFEQNPKVLAAGNGAVGLYVRSLAHCAGHLTDGAISHAWAKSAGTSAEIKKLVDVGMWVKTKDGYSVPDFLEFNRSKKDYEELREERRKAGRAGGLRSGESRRGEATDEANAKQVASPVATRGLEANANPVTVPVPNTRNGSDSLDQDSALDVAAPVDEKALAVATLREEIQDANELTDRWLGHYSRVLPPAAFQAARERLQERRRDQKRSRLESESRYVTSLLKDWHDTGRYNPLAADRH